MLFALFHRNSLWKAFNVSVYKAYLFECYLLFQKLSKTKPYIKYSISFHLWMRFKMEHVQKKFPTCSKITSRQKKQLCIAVGEVDCQFSGFFFIHCTFFMLVWLSICSLVSALKVQSFISIFISFVNVLFTEFVKRNTDTVKAFNEKFRAIPLMSECHSNI